MSSNTGPLYLGFDLSTQQLKGMHTQHIIFTSHY